MDFRITVRMEKRYGPKSRFTLLSKTTSPEVFTKDAPEDHEALWDLFNRIAAEVRSHQGPARKARTAELLK
jgi:hypothetical protein